MILSRNQTVFLTFEIQLLKRTFEGKVRKKHITPPAFLELSIDNRRRVLEKRP